MGYTRLRGSWRLTAEPHCDIPKTLVRKHVDDPHATGQAARVVLSAVAAACAITTLDLLRGDGGWQRFLPHSRWQLSAFVGSLYGAVFAGLALLLWLLLTRLSAATLLRVLWRAERPLRLSRGHQALLLLLPPLILGAALYPLTRLILHLFHHRGLTALLTATVAVGLLVPSVMVTLLIQSVLPRGDRMQTVLHRGPLSLYALGWMLGLLLLAGVETLMMSRLLANPRMDASLRALNLSLWTPLLAIGSLLIGHGFGRALAAKVGSRMPSLQGRTALVLLPLAAMLLGVCGTWLGYRQTLAQVDLRVVQSVALAVLLTLAGLWALTPLQLGRWRFPVLLLPVLLWLVAVQLGHSERVRKAAQSELPLSSQLLHVIAHLLDIDRDGVASHLAIGGTDCDDFDPEVYPGAFDWPEDGIDQNCNGHDARPTVARAPQAPLPESLPKKPHIILITIDALRADHMSCYGYARRTTPQLDALTNEPDSVLFVNAWAHAPSTRYSVPAILTGRYPSQIAWGSPWSHWPPEVLPQNRLLSEIWKADGYRTLAMLPYHYFEPSWGLARGFDDYDYHLQALHSLGGDPSATSGSSAKELTDLAEQKLRPLLDGEQPVFAWLHYYDPHFRYEPHPPPPGEPIFGGSETDLYDGEIRYTDEHIGRLLRLLKTSPAWNRTVVVVTADHGEGLGEHGIPPDRRHGYHLYRNQTQVPLIVRVPGLVGVQARKRVTSPVGHVDIMPTLVPLGGQPLPAESSGRSLWPLILGREAEDLRTVFQEVMYEGPTVRKALSTSRYHYIENLVPDGTRELYDVTSDPGEDHDLQGLRGGDEQRLHDQLSAWIDDSAVPPGFAEMVRGNLSTQPIASPTSVSAHIGSYLTLLGIDVRTPKVRRGGSLEVAVVLRSDKRIPAGYKLFAHLRMPGGPFVNGDHDFVSGLLPPQRLRPGNYVRDVTKLQVPASFPTGRATLSLGLYRRSERVPVSGDPLIALSSDQALQVATIDVE